MSPPNFSLLNQWCSLLAFFRNSRGVVLKATDSHQANLSPLPTPTSFPPFPLSFFFTPISSPFLFDTSWLSRDSLWSLKGYLAKIDPLLQKVSHFTIIMVPLYTAHASEPSHGACMALNGRNNYKKLYRTELRHSTLTEHVYSLKAEINTENWSINCWK